MFSAAGVDAVIRSDNSSAAVQPQPPWFVCLKRTKTDFFFFRLPLCKRLLLTTISLTNLLFLSP